MTRPEPQVRGLTPAWLAWCVFIAYGSLLPFDWRPAPPQGAVSAFLNMPWLQLGLASRLDWLANLMLYVPAGFLGTLALQQRRPDSGRAASAGRWLGAGAVATVLGVALALAIEFAQIFVAPRTVSLNDLVAEVAGVALGCALALLSGRYVLHLLARAGARGPASRSAWLWLYGLAYIALSLFPFDFSMAGSVFAQKLSAGHAGWWWSPYQHVRPLTGVLKLALEVVLVLPFGMALARGRRPVRWPAALLWGLALGAVIEFLQLFLLSATSQGASVVSRGVGLALGAALASRLPGWTTALTPGRLRAAVGLLALPWLLVVAYLAGWGRTALSLADWRQRAEAVSFLPFKHHYFAGEAQALTSVLQGIASFAGVGVVLALCAPRARARHAAWLAAAVCGGVEASKLLLAGQRPDPTNVLVAAAAAAAAWGLTSHLRGTAPAPAQSSQAVPATAPQRRKPAAHTAVAIDAPLPGSPRATAWALATACVIVASTWAAPGHLLGLLAGVAAYVLCVWRHPPSALLLVPVTIGLTDVASFTGHRWLEMPDLVILATGVIAVARPGTVRHAPTDATGPRWLGVVAGLLFVPGVVTGLAGAEWPDANALFSPLSPWNALLLAKGLTGAFVLVWFVHRCRVDAEAGARFFGRGMVLALAGVVFLTVWERLAFVGPFDFSSDYRAPGPFTAIALGGAYIESFLAAAAPFAVVGALRERHAPVRWACGLLLLAAAYATMVTYSRGGQVVFLAVVAATVMLLTFGRGPAGPGRPRPARLLAGAVLVSAVALVAATVLMSPYATTRFQQLDTDAQGRLDQWKQGMDFGRGDAAAWAFGNGLGSFGRESYIQGPLAGRPAVFLLHTEAGATHVRSHPGKLSYMDQRVDVRHGEPLTVSARLRSTVAPGLQALLCEKDLVQSRTCGVARLRMPADGQWHTVELPIMLPLNPQAGWPARPVRFTLFQGGGAGMVEVDDLSLRNAQGEELLRNGDFSEQSARWVYSSDMHLVWHMKNLWLQVLFEQGVSGALAHAALLLAGLMGAWRAARHSDWFWPFAMSLLAIQGVGLIDSVIDSPRFLQFYLSTALLAWHFGFRSAAKTRRSGAAAQSTELNPHPL
jgi:VanZ family protein